MAVYTFDYDSAYSPAAPVVGVEIGTEHSAETRLVSALVDSGADATLLPKDLLTQLKAQPVDVRNLRTVTGARITVKLYRVQLRIGPHLLRNIRAVGIEPTEGAIVGRDVLNQLTVTLDGPAMVSEIHG
ncbi:MAG: retropepsin-like aspartic protease [Caldilineaceae bacterium]